MTETKFYDNVEQARMVLDAKQPELSFNRAVQNVDFTDNQQALSFLIPQMLRIEQAVHMIKIAKSNYAEYMPVETAGTVWTPGSLFEVGDIFGKPEWFTIAADDMPYVATSQKQFIQENHIRAIGFQYNRQELERARMLGTDIITKRISAATTIAGRDTHNLAMKGDGDLFKFGFINDTAVTPIAAGAVFDAMTPEAFVKLINTHIVGVETDTKQNYEADTVLLPLSLRSKMADPMTEGSRSIMEYLREKAVKEVNFKFSIDLNVAGVGGKPRILVYSNTSEVHKVHLPGGGIEFGEVKNDGHYKWSRPGIYGFGGYENCIPLAKRAIDSN